MKGDLKAPVKREIDKYLNNRFGFFDSVFDIGLDPDENYNLVLPRVSRIYLFVSGHISWGSNNGVYMFIYQSTSSPVRVINLAGTWSATITGGLNGVVKIETTNGSGIRGCVYMVSETY